MYDLGYSYACIVGQTCIVVVIMLSVSSLFCWYVMMLICWPRWSKRCRSLKRGCNTDLRVRADHHTGLYVGHAGMWLMFVISIMVTHVITQVVPRKALRGEYD